MKQSEFLEIKKFIEESWPLGEWISLGKSLLKFIEQFVKPDTNEEKSYEEGFKFAIEMIKNIIRQDEFGNADLLDAIDEEIQLMQEDS